MPNVRKDKIAERLDVYHEYGWLTSKEKNVNHSHLWLSYSGNYVYQSQV